MPIEVPIQKLNREHDEYATFKIAWEKIDLLVASGERLKLNAQGLLSKRPKEPDDVWYVRLAHFTSTPILGMALGWYRSALFKRQPEIGAPSTAYYSAFMNDCDRQGTKFIDQAKTMFDHLMQFRRSWIMVDAPSPDTEPQSLLEEKTMGLDAPYSIIRDPREVINWSTDKFGNLDWVLTRSIETSGVFLGDDKPKMVWCFYDRTGFKRYEAELESLPRMQVHSVEATFMFKGDVAIQVDQGPHVLTKYNTVPFKQIEVPSTLWLANRVYLMCLNYLDTENTHSWNLRQANLAMPILFTNENPNITLSEVSMIKLGKDDKFGFTEPGGKSFSASEERLNALREEIFRCVYLIAAGRSSNSTASMQSGFSKTLDWQPASDVLNAYADIVRSGMEGILKMIAFARRDESATFSVHGMRFEDKDIVASAAIGEEVAASYTALNTPVVPRMVRVELMKQIARDALEDCDESDLKKIEDQIEAMPDPEVAQANATDAAFQQSFSKLTDRTEVREESGSADE